MTAIRTSSTAQTLFAICFWLFNLSLLLVLYLGFLPFLGLAILLDVFDGQVPLNFMLPFVGLVGVPSATAVAGIFPQQKRKLSLPQLFYGIEAPLLILCVLRFFFLRDLTPGSTFLLVSAVLSCIAFAHWLLSTRHLEVQLANWLHLAGQSILLACTLYGAAIAAFWLVPILEFTAANFFILLVWLGILFPLAFLLLGSFSMPIGMTLTYGQAWPQSFQFLLVRHGKFKVSAFVAVVLATWTGLFILFQQQSQGQVFALLQNPPQTDRDRQELLQKSDLIRRGLLNAYLSPYRYPRLQDTSILDYYHGHLQLPLNLAQLIQSAYDTLTAPFLYQGTAEDQEKAARLYAEFFDTPIARGERAAIQTAIRSTFNRGEAKAGLLDVNQQRVWLAEQEVTVTSQGDWADVEIHEVYDNKTFQQEEILYFFSLPESAVVTGVWLGETGDRSQRYPFQVATRGAAQQVYNQEVQRRVDPALLEQVGPRNYRLRAFPIPPLGEGRMHLWLTYKVVQQDGNWPLPQLSERRNVYWTGQTKRLVNGKTAAGQDQWLPAALPAQASPAIAHQVTLPQSGHILANPFADSRWQLPAGKHFAVILDDSYSMNAHQQAVKETFNWLQKQIVGQNKIDLYQTAAAPAQPQRLDNLKQFDANQAVFYGTLQPRQMLQQFQQLRGDTPYDAVILITDAGSYELSQDSKEGLAMPAPLWMLHLGGFQPAYDDATLEAIQSSGGNVSTQIQDVMRRIATQPGLGEGTSLLNITDGYAWFLSRSPNPTAAKDDEGFAPLAARQWVAQVSEAVKPTDLTQLDAIHAVAKKYEIVTPYSSMIVLVNDQQREDLKRAEQQRDRFDREVEDQQLPQPTGVDQISAVPEPAEGLLLIIGLGGLGLLYHQQKQLRSLG